MPLRARLRTEALAARAAHHTDRAVAAWRALLDLTPEDWRMGLELRQDLRAGGHYPDSDPRFRRAARHLPDGDWLAHYAPLYAFHGSDLPVIAARAQMLLARLPADPKLHAILGDVARQRRDWAGAAEAFAAAAALDPHEAAYRHKADAARLYARLAGRAWPAGKLSYTACVINLDANTERLAEIGRQFAGAAVPLRRQPAIAGSDLSAGEIRRLTGLDTAPRGTLGCFLSHEAAWRALAGSGEGHGLILEDDVVPLVDLPPALDGLGIPDGFDLCFVNDRLEPKLDCAAASGLTPRPLADVMAAFDPADNAPGADGYILSRAGAVKLLEWVAADGMAGDVDWRLLAYALTPGAVAAIPAHAVARQELDWLQAKIPRAERLRAYALHPALVRTVGVSSDREDQNRIPPPLGVPGPNAQSPAPELR